MELRPLTASDSHAARALWLAAFAQDPVQAWVFAARQAGFSGRLAAYCSAYQCYHLSATLPTLALFDGGELVAAAWFTHSTNVCRADLLAALGQQIATGCGAASLARLDQLNCWVEQQLPASWQNAPSTRLEFLAVQPTRQGQGLGYRLLGEVQRASRANLLLETASAINVAWYQRCGFVPWGQRVLAGVDAELVGMGLRLSMQNAGVESIR
ncbi:GNAT family N-acetyltransferase [Atopomonas sediminilitoris]|uniref:GNAT family N-acetyltransferase n=1 Tax=Atopomonas sediminilitoris TaxID=2919919 RepID=UPI001F4E48AC|nr:GNAT family N-acetyltransferase [Atopomonas sediminilitoris]MCJ8168308.1 GNAT family N-acetyltransferase [Atopomonas sediminilitoris]